jgi:hypothetical protein
MPYDVETYEDPQEILKKAQEPGPFGPGFSEGEVRGAARLVLVGSSFNDPGEDWTRWELRDKTGRVIRSSPTRAGH